MPSVTEVHVAFMFSVAQQTASCRPDGTMSHAPWAITRLNIRMVLSNLSISAANFRTIEPAADFVSSVEQSAGRLQGANASVVLPIDRTQQLLSHESHAKFFSYDAWHASGCLNDPATGLIRSIE